MTVLIDDQELDAVAKAVAEKPRRGRPPGQQGTLNRKIDYKCDCCGRPTTRDNLFVREVTFIKLSDRKRQRTRRCGWICRECMTTHPDFDRERYKASPGMRDVNAKE